MWNASRRRKMIEIVKLMIIGWFFEHYSHILCCYPSNFYSNIAYDSIREPPSQGEIADIDLKWPYIHNTHRFLLSSFDRTCTFHIRSVCILSQQHTFEGKKTHSNVRNRCRKNIVSSSSISKSTLKHNDAS